MPRPVSPWGKTNTIVRLRDYIDPKGKKPSQDDYRDGRRILERVQTGEWAIIAGSPWTVSRWHLARIGFYDLHNTGIFTRSNIVNQKKDAILEEGAVAGIFGPRWREHNRSPIPIDRITRMKNRLPKRPKNSFPIPSHYIFRNLGLT